MNHRFFIIIMAFAAMTATASAQVMSGASNTIATDVPHTTIPYRIEDKGTKLPDIIWGLDQAWISEGNMRRGLNFASIDMIDIVRLSFQPSHSVEGGALSSEQKKALDERIRIAKYARFATINLNCDPQAGKEVASWYKTSNSATNGKRWAQLIGLTKQYVESKGLKVVSISPFNEPDEAGWNQGTNATFKAICKAIREDEQFNGVLLCGGNSLNTDKALEWYNPSKEYLDEGNTHELAGSFDNFANFFKTVVADGKVAVDDELHNTMECMVGSEYGLTKGIWWGTCDHTRSQFMKASRGTRMGYAENRERWVAASVYRHTDDYQEGCSVQGFVGTSERQATASTFRFAALDHDVFYNGQGPTRECIIRTPGTPDPGGYDMVGKYCRNAEGLVNIQGGDDIMPVLPTEPTTYRIVNKLSGRALAPFEEEDEKGNKKWIIAQMTIDKKSKAQQWLVTPDVKRTDDDAASPQPNDVGGDFTYFVLSNVGNPKMYPDVLNWSLEDRGEIIPYQGGLGDNEKWFFEYAGDGAFYIRSKHSALYLQADPMENGKPASETDMKKTGRPVIQGVFTGEGYQQWKLIPVDVTYNSKAPAVPTALMTTPQPASVRLDWTAPADRDIMDYIVLRSTDQATWNTIHNHVLGTTYIDNTVADGITYYYKVKAVDLSLNRSEASEIASGSATETPACIMLLTGDSLLDATINGNHAAVHGTLSVQDGKSGQAFNLVPSRENFLQLPATIVGRKELTVSTWIYYRGGNQWQRIFDFGNDTNHYLFLTPNNSYTSKMRLAIKNGGTEQSIDTNVPTTNKWTHIAVTFSESKIVIYVNGKMVASNTSIKTRPADFQPIFNYIGRSQFTSDPFFNGAIDDFRIYNYALTVEEVAAIANLTDGVDKLQANPLSSVSSLGNAFDLSGRPLNTHIYRKGIYIIKGRKVMIQ